MEAVVPALFLLAAVLVSSVVAQLVPKVPVSLVQIALGVLIAVLPLPVHFEFDSEFFLMFFIAPLLYWDATQCDKQALWRQRTPVLAFAIGLVILIVTVVGFFTHWLVPEIPLALAFALGAALAPTDAVVVSSLSKRVAIPPAQKTLLEGESLFNDASGVVSFQVALAALVTGTFSLVDASLSLVWTFLGGIGLGILIALAKGLAVRWVRRLGLEDVIFHVLLQLMTPFAVYLVAEGIGVSGILAVVAAGIVDSLSGQGMAPSLARLNIVSGNVWKVISFALNGVVFVMLGTLLPQATERTWASATPNVSLVEYVLLIALVLVAVRFAWCLACARLEKGPDGKHHRLDPEAVRQSALLTLAGAKGAITLAICLTIPRFIGTGEVLQTRELVIFLGAGVILVTLLAANLIVPLIAPKKTVERSESDETSERVQILRNVINELSHDESLTDKKAVRRVIASYDARIERLKSSTAFEDASELTLRERAIGWETLTVGDVIREGQVAPIVGYGYLFELERRLARLHHRGELVWFVKNATGWFGTIRRAGFKDWGVTPAVRASRREARDRLRLQCAERVLSELRSLAPGDEYPVETISHLMLEYQRVVANIQGDRQRSARLSRRSAQVDNVMRVALQIERDEIGRAFEADRISRETARSMRDNVVALEYDLGDHRE